MPIENSGETARPDPRRWLADHGDALFRYALLRLADRAAAEDAVQETLLAALRGAECFSGRSSERTWLIGILKHKLLDHMRSAARGRAGGEPDGEPAELEDLFTRHGLWKAKLGRWDARPDHRLESREFWDVFVSCLSRLPPPMAYAFTLRELEHMEGEEICRVLEISPTNLWTLLHRARARLRRCLEIRWFESDRER